MTWGACLKRRSSHLHALNRYATKTSCFLLLYCVVLCCLVVLCCVVLHWLRLGGSPARSDTFLCGVSLWLSSTSTWICPSVENLQHEAETLCSPLSLLCLTSGPTLPSDLHYSACFWLTILSCIWHNSWVSKSSLDLWLRADWMWLKKESSYYYILYYKGFYRGNTCILKDHWTPMRIWTSMKISVLLHIL